MASDPKPLKVSVTVKLTGAAGSRQELLAGDLVVTHLGPRASHSPAAVPGAKGPEIKDQNEAFFAASITKSRSAAQGRGELARLISLPGRLNC